MGRAQATARAAPDISGIDQFWRIADVLVTGREPAPEMWDALFQTPGYAALQTRERRRADLTAGIRAALSPANRSLRDSLLKLDGWAARVIRHVQTLPARRVALEAFAAQFREKNVLAAAIVRAQALLPPGAEARFGTPPVAFIFFLPDGRGYPGLIVADLAKVANDVDPVAFFAHEATHFYWARLSADRERDTSRRPVIGAGPERLASLLMKIAEESAGDQFDKLDAVTSDSLQLTQRYSDPGFLSYLLQYRRELAVAEVQLRRLDSAIAQMGAQPDRMMRLADSASNALPLEGRPVGMYMAQAIRRELGDARFAQVAGDPVAYFVAYQSAAARNSCGCIAFSPETMSVVSGLLRINPGVPRRVRRHAG
jgi:hypothetical protein